MNDLNGAVNDLPEEDKTEFDTLHNLLKKYIQEHKGETDENNNVEIKDILIKNRLASFILKLINETGRNEKLIQETCYIITSFIFYKIEDKLGEAIEIAGELELPKEHASENFFDEFDRMKNLIKGYLS